MGPGPALREPPQVALANRLTDLADRPEASMQIVLCEEGLLGRDLLHGMRGAHGTQATAFSDIARATGAIGEEHASVAGILRVRGGVEEIAPQEGRDREDQRMARAEEMDGFRRVQALLRGNDDADEIPESAMTAPGNPRNAWMPSRTIESRARDFPRMYAFVIRICAPNRVAKSPGGMIGRFGLTTGARVGVATRPCPVSSSPIRARPSRSRISNMRGHRSPVNKAFPRRRAPPRKGYLSRRLCHLRCSARRSFTLQAWATGRRNDSGGGESERGTISHSRRGRAVCPRASRIASPTRSSGPTRRCAAGGIGTSRGTYRPGTIGAPGPSSRKQSRIWTSRRPACHSVEMP